MINPGWSADFQNLILRIALRGDFLTARIPLDPELFGAGPKNGISPAQEIAEIITNFSAKQNRTPTRAEFEQLVDEAGRGRPERAEVLQDRVAQIMIAELPEDPSFIFDKVVPVLQARKLARAISEAAPLLSDPSRIAEAQEIIRGAQEPIVPVEGEAARAIGMENLRQVRRRLGVKTEWLVEGMLAEGDMSVIIAAPYVGKSYLLAQLVASVAQGVPFLNRPTKQGPVVCFLFEGAKKFTNLVDTFGGDDAYSEIEVWTETADTKKNPAAWMRKVLDGRVPSLIVVDTLAGLMQFSSSANSGGYDEAEQKMGPILNWAMNNKVHVILAHHSSKSAIRAAEDEVTAGIGSIGITAKPGTVLIYRLMNRADLNGPRVLAFTKNRESEDGRLPEPQTIEIDPETRRIFPSGSRVQIAREVNVEEIGRDMLRVVRQAMPSDPTGIRVEGEEGLLRAVEGKRQDKLEALRTLTEPDGPLERVGVARSRTEPLKVRLRAGKNATADADWRDRWTRRAAPLQEGEEV